MITLMPAAHKSPMQDLIAHLLKAKVELTDPATSFPMQHDLNQQALQTVHAALGAFSGKGAADSTRFRKLYQQAQSQIAHLSEIYNARSIKQIGQGQFGQTSVVSLRLQHTSPKAELIAVKKLFKDGSHHGSKERWVAILESELRILSHLSDLDTTCTHVVRMHFSCSFRHGSEMTVFIGMELADHSYAEHIASEVWLDAPLQARLEKLKDFCKQIDGALSFLHENRVVHCDLTPSNLLCFSRQEQGQLTINIADFGLAGFKGDRIGAGLGQWTFMPPEVFDQGKRQYAYEIDLFSVGMLLWVSLRPRNAPWLYKHATLLEPSPAAQAEYVESVKQDLQRELKVPKDWYEAIAILLSPMEKRSIRALRNLY